MTTNKKFNSSSNISGYEDIEDLEISTISVLLPILFTFRGNIEGFSIVKLDEFFPIS